MTIEHDTAREPGSTRVAIVAHTHWDREWYRPFQAYRHDLVHLLDELLPRLEADPGFRHFLLDGQTIVVDDYLEVRPEAGDRLRALVESGRLAIGPWAVLMDEFCVGGETIVRNLQRGMARAESFGGALPVGYLPDMFGHIAQMPQLLRQAGLEHAVVWRGVPRAVDRTAFWWEAPDGSRVRAEYLYGSYANGRDVTADPARLVGLAASYETELGPRALPGGALLLMHGADHRPPDATLPEVVAAANAHQDRFRFRIVSLPEYLADQPSHALSTWRGELRSGAFTNLLMGVFSNRVDVHQATAAAERALVSVAEPLAALFVPTGVGAPASPVPFLDLAWDRLIANSAHDSACACSVDDVVDQVLVRAREARTLAEGVTQDAMRWLAATVDAPTGAWVVANPSARARGGVVEIAGPDDGSRPAAALTQVVGREEPEEVLSGFVEGTKIGWVVELLEGDTFGGERVAAIDLRQAGPGAGHLPDHPEVVIRLAAPHEAAVDVTPWRARLRDLAGDDRLVRVRSIQPGRTRWVVGTPPVAGFGWLVLGVDAATASVTPVTPVTPVTAIEGPDDPGGKAGPALTNGLVTIAVEPAGTFSLTTADGVRATGLARLLDGGDGGDTYTYSPPAADRLIETPEAVTTTMAEAGPVRGRLVVEARYRWPTHAHGDDRRCTSRAETDEAVTVRTTYEVRAGEGFVRVRHDLVNPCRDHRLRAHFPLPAPVSGSDAECAYAVVRRGLDAEGGPHEPPLPTYPSRRFVDASDGEVGLAVVHDGLHEYELVDGGTELAVTLFRAVGWLSRREPDLRPNPAGPALATPGAQMLGSRVAEYAVVAHRGDWRAADLFAVADQVLVPLPVAQVTGTFATRPMVGQALTVTGAEVAALRTVAGGLEVRVFNPTAAPAKVSRPAGARRVDLRGRAVAPDDGADGDLELGPAEIATLVVPPQALAAAWPPASR